MDIFYLRQFKKGRLWLKVRDIVHVQILDKFGVLSLSINKNSQYIKRRDEICIVQ